MEQLHGLRQDLFLPDETLYLLIGPPNKSIAATELWAVITKKRKRDNFSFMR